MDVLGKTVKDVYEAMLTAYQTCKDKRQGAENALAIYEQNHKFIEETKKILVELNDFVEILQESLNEQKNSNVRKLRSKLRGL